MDNRSTGSVLIFDRMKMSRRFSSVLTYIMIAYDIQPWLTNRWPESFEAFAVSSSVTKQPTVQMSQNATSAKKITNTIKIVRILSNVPIVMPNTWLAHLIPPRRFPNAERKDNNSHSLTSLLLLDCIRLSFER